MSDVPLTITLDKEPLPDPAEGLNRHVGQFDVWPQFLDCD